MIKLIGNLIAQAFTGKSLEEIEREAIAQKMAANILSNLPAVTTKLQKDLMADGVTDFSTDGHSFQASPDTLQSIYSNDELNKTWQLYLELVGMLDYFRGNAQRMSDRAYRKGFKDAENAMHEVLKGSHAHS